MEDPEVWSEAVAGGAGPLRMMVPLAWASCVSGPIPRSRMSKGPPTEPDVSACLALLRSISPEAQAVKRNVQQLRQVALCLQEAARAKGEDDASGAACEIAAVTAPWLRDVGRKVIFSARWRAQVRILPVFEQRLKRHGPQHGLNETPRVLPRVLLELPVVCFGRNGDSFGVG